MDKQLIGSLFTGLFILLGFWFYLPSLFRRMTPPPWVGWFVWVLVDLLTIAGMAAKGTLNAQVVLGTCGGVSVLVIAIYRGNRTRTWQDAFFIGGALAGIGCWAYTSDARVAIVISLFIVLLGAIPTLKAMWASPESESFLAWVFFTLSSVPVLATLPKWTLENAAQPLVWGAVNVLSLIIVFPSRGPKPPTTIEVRSFDDPPKKL